jgi:hypothetical protein
MKQSVRKLGLIGYVLLTGVAVTLLAVACGASAVWGS